MAWIASFHSEKSPRTRRADAAQMREAHADRVPVIVDRADGSAPEISRHKFLCPTDLSVGQFAFVIRKRIALGPSEALFLFCGDDRALPSTSESMLATWERWQSADGFLYVTYSLENTFGGERRRGSSRHLGAFDADRLDQGRGEDGGWLDAFGRGGEAVE